MSRNKYDLAVFIGRMQPVHNGHIHNIQKALELADNVLVVLGSANQPRTIKNPFTVQERTDILKEVFPTGRVSVRSVEDYIYQDTRWVQSVQALVHHHIVSSPLAYRFRDEETGLIDPSKAKIAILGHEKDESSFYLKIFPTWEFVEIPEEFRNEGQLVGGTEIRNEYFEKGTIKYGVDVLPIETIAFMARFAKTEEYGQLVKEYEYIKRYKESWKVAPYPVTFFTVDSVVIQSGHILLVRRKTEPGKGLWALPGGFLNPNERARDGAVRELREETKLKVPPQLLRGSIKAEMLFDAPNRSLRGRTITQAYLFDLPDQPTLPKVKGSDDAAEARWFPLDMVDGMSHLMFEDHQSIIHMMKAQMREDKA